MIYISDETLYLFVGGIILTAVLTSASVIGYAYYQNWRDNRADKKKSKNFKSFK